MIVRLAFAAAAALMGCTPAPAQAPEGGRNPDAAAAAPIETAPCRGNILRNPLFGIAGEEPEAGPGAPITRTFMDLPQTLWAWRTTGSGPLRWFSPETPGEGPLHLGAGRSVLQAGLGAPAGRWRLVIGASPVGDRPAALHGRVEGGDEAYEFDIEVVGQPTLSVVELDLPTGADRVILTGAGPGEVRLNMVCLAPLEPVTPAAPPA